MTEYKYLQECVNWECHGRALKKTDRRIIRRKLKQRLQKEAGEGQK